MAVKRSRIPRSSSSGEIALSHQPSTAADRRDSDRPRPAILSVSSPVVDGLSQGPGIGDFLDKGYYCKKMLRMEDDVFMYGYLQAFCRPDCRNKQIVIGSARARGKLSGGSRERRSRCCKMNND